MFEVDPNIHTTGAAKSLVESVNVIGGGDKDTAFRGGHTIDATKSCQLKERDGIDMKAYAFRRPLNVRELPSDSAAWVAVAAEGTPVDLESRVVEWVKDASRSSSRTIHLVGIRPMSCVRVLSLILLDPVSLERLPDLLVLTHPLALKLKA